jgi:hypothetical protein
MEGDGLYNPVLVKRFLLVEEAADIMNIPIIVQEITLIKVNTLLLLLLNINFILTFLKNDIFVFQSKLDERRSNERKNQLE